MVELRSNFIFQPHILPYSFNSTNMFGTYYVEGIFLTARDIPVNKMEGIHASMDLWSYGDKEIINQLHYLVHLEDSKCKPTAYSLSAKISFGLALQGSTFHKLLGFLTFMWVFPV